MKTLGLVTGAMMLASTAAMAGQPVALTDQQLDTVNAGQANVAEAYAKAKAFGFSTYTDARTYTRTTFFSSTSKAYSQSVTF